ncbi:MAG: hypothetical protein QM784_37655 [Polyangiaceae bacterium]
MRRLRQLSRAERPLFRSPREPLCACVCFDCMLGDVRPVVPRTVSISVTFTILSSTERLALESIKRAIERLTDSTFQFGVMNPTVWTEYLTSNTPSSSERSTVDSDCPARAGDVNEGLSVSSPTPH